MRKQHGMTTLGMLSIVGIIALLAFGAFKVTPAYLEMFKVYSIMDDLERELSGTSPDIQRIRGKLANRINIESVYGVDENDFVIKRSSDGYRVSLYHENEASYMGNLYLLVKYDKSVEVIK